MTEHEDYMNKHEIVRARWKRENDIRVELTEIEMGKTLDIVSYLLNNMKSSIWNRSSSGFFNKSAVNRTRLEIAKALRDFEKYRPNWVDVEAIYRERYGEDIND